MNPAFRAARGLAWPLVVAVLLGAGACSSNKPSGVRQDANAQLTVWVRQLPDSAAAATANKLVNAFQQKTKIPVKLVATMNDFETRLQQQGDQHQLPDIVINDTAQLGNMQRQGWLNEVDRPNFSGADQIAEQAWQATRASDGRYYAVPFSAQSFAIFMRKDWRLKLKLPEPKTWDDVAAIADAFTHRDPDGNGKADTYGWIIPGTTLRGYASWHFSSFLWANGGDFVTAVSAGRWRAAINEPPAVQAASWLKEEYCKNKVVVPDSNTMDTTKAHEAFEKGLGGIYLTGPYVLSRFVKSIGSDKLEVFPLPKGPSGGPGALAEGENVYLMANSANRAGQQKFAEFAASVEGQTIGMDGDNAGPIVRLPVNKKVDLSKVRSDARWLVFQQVYDGSGVYTPNLPNWAPFRQKSADALNAIMANCGSDPQAEMDKLAGDFGSELRGQSVQSR